MDPGQIRQFLGDDWTRAEALFKETLHSDVARLDKTNCYILENRGKMLRPALSLLVSRACGKPSEESVKVAVAAELLHNATLLHDDVLDDGSLRRGVPTVASMIGTKPSVLIGDFWLVKAMKTVLDCTRHTRQMADLFSKTVLDLVQGEMLQMEKAASGDTTEEDYLQIIYYKTASLFETVCAGAALSVDAPEQYAAAVSEYGRQLGLAFQIKDDILDYEGDALGKPVGADLRERKITLPLLGALKKVDALQEARIRQMVCDIPSQEENSRAVAGMVESLQGTRYAALRLEEYVSGAKDALHPLPDSEEKELLLRFADYCAYRTI